MQSSYIFSQENAFKNVVCEMVAILLQPQWFTDDFVPGNLMVYVDQMCTSLR